MSDSYIPRFDGVNMDGRQMPGRDPMTGQFVSSKPDVHDPAWHDRTNHLPSDKMGDIPNGMHLISGGDAQTMINNGCIFDSNEQIDNEPDADRDAEYYEYDAAPDPRPRDKYDVLAERHFVEEQTDDSTMYRYFDNLCQELGLNSWEYDFYTTEDREEIITVWMQRTYGYLWTTPSVDTDEFSDQFDHLPTQESMIRALGLSWYEDHDRQIPKHMFVTNYGNTRIRWVSDSHGVHGRLNGTKLRKHRQIRKARADTFRQMDSIWERDMAEPMSLSLDEYLDAMYEQESSEIVQIWSNRDYYTRLLKLNDIDDSFAETMDWDTYPSLQDHNHEADEREWYELDALTETYHNGDFSDESTLVNLTMDDSEHYDPFYDYGPWSDPEGVDYLYDDAHFAAAGR